MREKSALLAIILILAILLAVGGGIFLLFSGNYLIDFHFYPKNAASMDLRGEDISIEHYDALRKKMPNCEILWNVPIQNGRIPSDTTELPVDTLSEQDVAVIAYFPELEVVHAEDCWDYGSMARLRETYPNVKVLCQVMLDETTYPPDAETVELHSASPENLARLPFLTELRTVTAVGGGESQDISALSQYCRENGLAFRLRIGNELVEQDVQEVTAEDVTGDDLSLLDSLPELKKLHMVNPKATRKALMELPEAYPDIDITWEVSVAGVTFQSTDTEIDLSQVEITDLAEVELEMQYLPNAEKVIFGLCGRDNPDWGNSKAKGAACDIENEDMAAYRDRVRDQYKVVWTVRLGPSIALRTDKDNFMPNHFGVGRLFDDYAYNLRYCEDMVCLDVGHMTLTDISFVSYMPKLKYLILAWTEVQYIEPIRSCKNLIWLELDNSCIRDYSPLVDCTALEDLNLGKT